MSKKEFIPLEDMPTSATKGSDLTPEEELLLKELEVRGELSPEQEEAFERTLKAAEHAERQDAFKPLPKETTAPRISAPHISEERVTKHLMEGAREEHNKNAGAYQQQQKGQEERLFPAPKPPSIFQESGVHHHRGHGRKLVSHESHGKHGRKPPLPKGAAVPHKRPETEQ